MPESRYDSVSDFAAALRAAWAHDGESRKLVGPDRRVWITYSADTAIGQAKRFAKFFRPKFWIRAPVSAFRREPKRQHNVVGDRPKREQVELLKNHPDLFGTVPIACPA